MRNVRPGQYRTYRPDKNGYLSGLVKLKQPVLTPEEYGYIRANKKR